jgi:hypothetical protein
MANTPEAGIELSDDDLDELVQAEMSDVTPSTSTTDPAPPSTEPAAEEAGANSTETSEGANSADGEERDGTADGQPAAAAAGEVNPADAGAAPAATIPEGAKPFTYQATKATHTLAGALELPDGSVVIQKDALPDFRRLLASEREFAANFTQFRRDTQRQLNAAKAERTARETEAEAIVKLFEDVLKMDPDQRYDWAMKLDEERPKLELEVQRAQLARDREALQRERAGPELSPEEQQERFTAVVTQALEETFQRLMTAPEAKALTKEEVQEIYQRWQRRPQRLFRQATEDGADYKKGDTVYDDAEIVEDFRFAIGLKKKQPATPAAARNAALNADTATQIPPAVRPGRVPTQPAKKKAEKFDRDAFMRGELDDQDVA